MKKLFTVVLCVSILLPLLFTACQRESEEEQNQEQVQEGVYNPQKKIDRIFSNWRLIRQVFSQETNSWETVEQVDGPLASSEIWQWNGDELESITYYEDGVEYGRADFSYHNNRIHSISVTDDLVAWRNLTYYYSYDGDKLSSIQSFQESTMVEDFQIIHTGNKITKIIYYENFLYTKNLPSHPIAINPTIDRILTSLKTKYKTKGIIFQGVINLEWDGNNISRASVAEDMDDESWVVEYTYDTKTNPYYGMLFWYGHDGYRDMFTSQNNVLTEKCTYLESEGVAWSDEYSYTYNGDWPISVRSLVSASSYYNDPEREMNELVSHIIYK